MSTPRPGVVGYSHVAGAWGVGLQRAGEAEAVPAGALGLAVHLARHAHCPLAVGHARAPAHQRIVLHSWIPSIVF